MQKPHKSIRIFKSSILEKFTHVHPVTPFILWAPIFSWIVWRNLDFLQESPVLAGTLGASGFLIWTLTEYILHRYLFHFESDTALGQRIQFLIHGLHHADPLDPTRLVMPPVASLALGGCLFLIFRTFLGSVWVEPFFAFFIIGYLCYDYIHYYVHHFTPTTRFGKYLKNSHMQHHYISPNTRWGVSTPLWDHVFGTMYDAKSTASSSKNTSSNAHDHHRHESRPEVRTSFKDVSSREEIESSL